MSYQVIITEKPDAAKKIAYALSEGKVDIEKQKGATVYKIKKDNKTILIGCAAGHLFTISSTEKTKSDQYPVYEIDWFPTYKVRKEAAFTKKFYDALKSISKDADDIVVACDYDIEGEVIGLNIVKYIFKRKDAKRMKFSTLTKPDLIKSYENMSPTLDWGQANAGETRHKLDWLYGINISKALTKSIKTTGTFKVMSIGRVQGPALKTLYEREKEIQGFIPEKFWVVSLKAEKEKHEYIAIHKKDKFNDKSKAQEIFDKVNKKDGKVKDIKSATMNQMPPFPFDLTTLQTESYRLFHISPKETLAIAEELYLASYTSYPRTSSQKLPKTIGYKKIITNLMKQQGYEKLCAELLGRKILKPNEGKKNDSAHPAIYPTGVAPNNLKERPKKVYDLIVKRFLATFAEPAKRKSVTLTIDVESEDFVAKGITTTKPGWHRFYEPYLKLKEKELPIYELGEKVNIKKFLFEEKETQPPKRYTPASIIKELEKRNLGTKATRANIIDTLYKRGYASGVPICISNFGIATVDILNKYSSEILDEKLTRNIENEMELIRQNKKKEGEVIDESKDVLDKILNKFKKEELSLGKELKTALFETQKENNELGDCPICKKGKLVIKKGKYGRFVGCTNYPECTVTVKLYDGAKVKKTNKVCEACGFPIIKIIRKRKAQEICLNPNCPKKSSETKTVDKNSQNKKNSETETKSKTVNENNNETDLICPKCGKKLVKRKSIYGEFYGCSGFPKCKYTQKIK